MTRTLVLSEHDLAGWSARFTAGEVSAALPYGINALTEHGHALAGVQTRRHTADSKLIRVAEHRLGAPVERPLRAAWPLRSADLSIALLEREGELYGHLRARGIPPFSRTPLVVWSCWLADNITRADRDQRAAITRWLRGVDLVTFLAESETDVFLDLGMPPERLYPLHLGASHHYYTPGPMEQRDIAFLAVGQDRGRDYTTLIDAVRGTDLVLDIVTRPEMLTGITLPDNVRVHGTVPLHTYRDLLRRAQVVVVPTLEMAYPTGSSVALEAASSGAALAVTGTRAMREYLHDGHTADLVDVGDVDGWRRTLLALRDDPARRSRLGAAARRAVEDRFNTERMWRELAGVIADRSILDRRRLAPW